MITAKDFYNVMSAVVPLYVAMILAYGSVRWWKILTPDQCSGINRFVAIFAVPLLSFEIISRQNPYQFNRKFVIADALQKFVALGGLSVWAKFSRKGSLDWVITFFMLATLPNTLVVGIPLLTAMYGETEASIVIQAVVLQSIVWYTLLLFIYEYRGARLLILQKFPKTKQQVSKVVTVKIDPATVTPELIELKTEASVGEDGKFYVHLMKSPTSSMTRDFHSGSPAKTPDLSPGFSSKASTPTASELSNAEIYSVRSSCNATPCNSFNRQDFFLAAGCCSPAEPHFFDQVPPFLCDTRMRAKQYRTHPNAEEHLRHLVSNQNFAQEATQITKKEKKVRGEEENVDCDTKELQMFVWSASTSPATSPIGSGQNRGTWREEKLPMSAQDTTTPRTPGKANAQEELSGPDAPSKRPPNSNKEPLDVPETEPPEMPSTAVMLKMILGLVWKKLVRNPNTYSSLFGLAWALIKFRWNVQLPAIIDGSIKILSNTGLGMAMFSLGLFMALQSRLLACGTYMAVIGMIIRFVTGPAIMSAASFAVGLHNLELRASILQAALSQGIVPFVFAKEYNVHPDVLGTAVIFGMLVSLPIVLAYYVLLGL